MRRRIPSCRQSAGLVDEISWMGISTCSYLPDDILTEVDRANMAEGFEVRVPLLDNPGDCQLLQDLVKGPTHGLRQLAYFPEALLGRPEMGVWLRGQLKDWAEGLLTQSATLEREGLLSPKPLARTWPGTARKMRGISPGTW